MKKIIVAIDFSIASRNAALYAIEVASAIKAEILLFHAYEPPVFFNEVPPPLSYDELIQSAERELMGVRKYLLRETSTKINIDTEVAIGPFFSELEDLCNRLQPYTVVIGCQGTTAAKRLLFGSHAVYATRHLQWPVIAVPIGTSFSSIRRIGFSCDFEKTLSAVPVDDIKRLVKDLKAELHVIHSARIDEFVPGKASASELIKSMFRGIDLHMHIIAGAIDEYIIEFAEMNMIDLLIVIPKRRGLIDQLVHKSHTKQFVLNCHIPVMAIHSRQLQK